MYWLLAHQVEWVRAGGNSQKMGEAFLSVSDAMAWAAGSVLMVVGGLIARGNYPLR